MTDVPVGGTKKVLYIDMDNTLVDFQSGIDKLSEVERRRFEGDLDDVSGIFSLMDPMPGAVEAFQPDLENGEQVVAHLRELAES